MLIHHQKWIRRQQKHIADRDSARGYRTEIIFVIIVPLGREPNVFQRRRKGQGQRISVKLDVGIVQHHIIRVLVIELSNRMEMEGVIRRELIRMENVQNRANSRHKCLRHRTFHPHLKVTMDTHQCIENGCKMVRI